jgi:hypothetical protein
MPDISLDEKEHISLCEALDRILNKGAVVVGEVIISVANIDLIYLGLQVILSSVETARKIRLSDLNPYSPSKFEILQDDAVGGELKQETY